VASSTQTSAAAMPPAPVTGHAVLGQTAPDFALPDLDGYVVHLADSRGKVVVLEWFNPECPFVRASHTKGSLKGTAKRFTDQGVVWLAINSSASGKQGYGLAKTAGAKRAYGLEHPVLLDESGDVGHTYGATNTPHLFVIDKSGTLVYRGAIDNSPDGEGESPTGGKLVNYVDATLADLTAGRPIAVPSTQAYGCGVKYARP
jgi:peroxiredoxin